MFNVVRDEGQVVGARRRRDEHVEVLDEHASSAQVRFDLAEGQRGFRIKPQNNDAASEGIDRSLVGLGSSRTGGAVTELRQRDDREAYPLQTDIDEAVSNRCATP